MNKRQALKEFTSQTVKNHFPQSGSTYTLTSFISDDFGPGGLTDAEIYQVKDKQNHTFCFIKGYFLELEHLKQQRLLIAACEILQKLPLKHLHLVLPIAQHHIVIDNKFYEMTATPKAPGTNIVLLLEKLGKGKISLERILEITKQSSIAIGELNSLSTHTSESLPQRSQKANDLCINVFRLYLTENPELFPFSLKEFESKFAKIFIQAHKTPFVLGHTHGDCNLSNLFFDEETKKISLIDCISIFSSILPNAQPNGNVAHEYAYLRKSYEIFGLYYGLSEQQRKAIDEAFTKSYPLKLPAIHVHYFDLLTLMAWFLIAYKTSLRNPGIAPKLLKLMEMLAGRIKVLLG